MKELLQAYRRVLTKIRNETKDPFTQKQLNFVITETVEILEFINKGDKQ